jgi:hypothetical protein
LKYEISVHLIELSVQTLPFKSLKFEIIVWKASFPVFENKNNYGERQELNVN